MFCPWQVRGAFGGALSGCYLPEKMPIRSRLAPTPSGLLHPGNAVSFLLTWGLVRAWGGTLVLRIDDLDAARRRRDYVEDIFRSIEWLGLDYDEGPSDVESLVGRYSQQHRLPRYLQAVERLRTGGHLFACTCSRRDIREASATGRYPGTCREKDLSFSAKKVAWRIKVPPEAGFEQPAWPGESIVLEPGRTMGDFVVLGKNRVPAYQVASLMDDLEMGINFVVRGTDLWPSTAAQRFLAESLDEPAFARIRFWHHRLLTGPSGEKLSKSKGAGSLQAWREAGRGPETLVEQAAGWLGMKLGPQPSSDELRAAIARQWPKPPAFPEG